MKTKILLLVAAFALSSCAEMGSVRAADKSCAGGTTCSLTVTVTSGGPNGCTIAAPDNLNVGRSNTPTTIQWNLSGDAKFKFASPGIAFDKANGPPPGRVMAQNGAGGGRTVTMTDRHKDDYSKGRWDYSIYVTDGASANCPFDPWVDNN